MLRENLNFKGIVLTDALEIGETRKFSSLKYVINYSINVGNNAKFAL